MVLVVIGEEPYAEMKGDDSELRLAAAELQTLKTARRAGVPTVVILLTGRPLLLDEVLENADAVLVAWLPGSEGQGVSDVLFGTVSPTGRLSHSWPKTLSQVPINLGDEQYDPLFPYGFGLTYPGDTVLESDVSVVAVPQP